MKKTNQTGVQRETEVGHNFIVFFLNEDEEQSVHVDEVEEIDFLQIIKHLNLGGSVFITQRREPEQKVVSRKSKL